MKNLFFIVAFISFISQRGRSQVTCPGAVLTTQAQVNQYVNDNHGCEVVTGDLYFKSNNSDPINDVSGLSSIIKIQGNCIFNYLTSLSDISFNSLDSVYGTFAIDFQQGLNSVSLNNISYVQNSFSIANTLNQNNSLSVSVPKLNYAQGIEINTIDEIDIPLLETCNFINIINTNTITGFNFLTSCQSINLNNANNIIGFNGLTSTGNLYFGFSVQQIEGFNSLQNASSYIFMGAAQVNGFNALQSGELQFQNNQIIEGFNSYNQPLNLNFNGQKINGFNAVTSGLYNIAADTIIGFNGLTSSSNLNLNAPYISGFNAIVSADQLNITTQNLSGFNTLTQANNINITADAISGFGSLSQVAILNLIGDLNTFDAFAQLDTISLSLSLQTQRSDYNIFPTLQNVEEVSISNSPNFTGSAFFPLAKIKNLFISNCGSLANLSGLLPRSKYGTLSLNNNPSLADLTGLETVKNVVNLTINGNTSLTNIEALDSLRIIQGNLTLVNNTSLNECCVLAFIINRNKVFGFIEISGNAHDCEDIVMVLEETCLDSDGDGLADPQDNCPTAHNTDQSDIDGDGVGDMCDNCIDIANSGQEDDNGDGIGNVCQPTAGTGYMDLNNSDLYITNNQRGVILKTRSGNCYRIRIDESGKVLSIPLLQCP